MKHLFFYDYCKPELSLTRYLDRDLEGGLNFSQASEIISQIDYPKMNMILHPPYSDGQHGLSFETRLKDADQWGGENPSRDPHYEI